MLAQTRAIIWAQYRVLWNYYSRGSNVGAIVAVVLSLLWYSMAIAGGVLTSILARDPERIELLARTAPGVLLFACGYWQLIPLALTSAGAALDLKRLRVYPVTDRQLFGLEVLLRFSTGVEVMLVLTGAAIGLLLNPKLPLWAPLALIPFIVFNLLLSAGLRDLVTRFMARRGAREILLFGLILLMGVPQVLLLTGVPEPVRQVGAAIHASVMPWSLTTALALGRGSALEWFGMLLWMAAASAFGWFQFQRGLRFDAEAAASDSRRSGPGDRIVEWIYRLPNSLFPDPLAAVVEKEIRFLSRAPRFRLVFLMGFSFGLIIWLPLAMGRGSDGFFATHYLTFVTVYALMLLGEVSFWNTFGFDRAAVQTYFAAPVPLSTVLAGKNIAAGVFVVLEISAVAAVCTLLRMPITLGGIVEAYAVTFVMTLFLVAIGNLGSTWYPQPVNPAQSWRAASASRVRAFLMFLYPVVAGPVALAYIARWATGTQMAFYGVLAVTAAIGSCVYWVAMDSAVRRAQATKENIVAILSRGDGPVAL